MSERIFRFVLGAMLFGALTASILLENQIPLYVVLAIILFEFVTNWRVPIIVTRIRYGSNYKDFIDQPIKSECGIANMGILKNLEAERILRIMVLLFVSIPFFIHIEGYENYIDFIPWFVASMLCLAGVTNICPMVMFLRFTGMR